MATWPRILNNKIPSHLIKKYSIYSITCNNHIFNYNILIGNKEYNTPKKTQYKRLTLTIKNNIL